MLIVLALSNNVKINTKAQSIDAAASNISPIHVERSEVMPVRRPHSSVLLLVSGHQ